VLIRPAMPFLAAHETASRIAEESNTVHAGRLGWPEGPEGRSGGENDGGHASTRSFKAHWKAKTEAFGSDVVLRGTTERLSAHFRPPNRDHGEGARDRSHHPIQPIQCIFFLAGLGRFDSVSFVGPQA